MTSILYLVVPCYDEEKMLDITTKKLSSILDKLIQKKKIHKKSKILYVNDGSKDATWDKILSFHSSNSYVTGICLSRNRGHQNALYAGLMVAKEYADIVISLDGDLQDDTSCIETMIDQYHHGYDIVYGVRNSRKKDSFLKKFTANSFYYIRQKLGIETISNHADFRLTSKRVLDALEKYREVHLYLRGIIPSIGYPFTIVYYDRNERIAGQTKYSLSKMFQLAWDGISSFSIFPITSILYIGIFLTLFNLILLIISFVQYFMGIRGVLSILFFSIYFSLGFILIAIGIVGDYIGKVFEEVKARPRYIISRNLCEEDKYE